MNICSSGLTSKPQEKRGFDYSLSAITKGGQKILQDISFHINTGEIFGILGVNGAGKTTLLKSIVEPSDQNYLKNLNHDGIDLTDLSPRKKARLISHLGSDDLSKPRVKVQDFLRFAFGGEIIDQAKLENLINTLDTWGLGTYKDKSVSSLSEGEFQRVLLATIFLQEASVYVLDEPERHLDPAGLGILERVCIEKADAGKIIIIASHDINLALSVSDNILGLTAAGNSLFLLSPAEIKKEKALDALYNISFEYLSRPDGGLFAFRHPSRTRVDSGASSK